MVEWGIRADLGCVQVIKLLHRISSYFDGKKNKIAAVCYHRDGKRGNLQVNYGIKEQGRSVRPLNEGTILCARADFAGEDSIFDRRCLTRAR